MQYTSDTALLRIIDILEFEMIIPNPSAFCDRIGLDRTHLSRIRKGQQHFSGEHIKAACKEYGLNANCIIGLEKNVFRNKQTPVITGIKLVGLPATPKPQKNEKNLK